MQRYTVYLYLETAVHVSGGISIQHQERTQLYLQHLALVRPLLLPTVWQVPDALDTVVCAPDDGWRYHPKHVEQFPDINKLCKVASCWIYIGIYLRCTDPWTLKIDWFHVNVFKRLSKAVSSLTVISQLRQTLGRGRWKSMWVKTRWKQGTCLFIG